MTMATLDDLQRLTPSRGTLLYRLVELGYLTQAQVDDLVNRLVAERFAKATDYLEFAHQLEVGVSLNQEIDYVALRQAVENAFTEEYGAETVARVHVAHFNPDIVDVTVLVHERTPEMDGFALALSEALRRQGVRTALR